MRRKLSKFYCFKIKNVKTILLALIIILTPRIIWLYLFLKIDQFIALLANLLNQIIEKSAPVLAQEVLPEDDDIFNIDDFNSPRTFRIKSTNSNLDESRNEPEPEKFTKFVNYFENEIEKSKNLFLTKFKMTSKNAIFEFLISILTCLVPKK